ncbi:IreB family regulatory phosphoprotein [Agathobaculum sp. LCP25S3_E8]|uniref:IreB family regulatory phosphoprotein n=1 Tax=Agathobaculum sp. LCP25S3_E8 TaxID=3438735 RepID=UPI003F91CB59
MEIEFENIMDHIVESIRAAGYEPYDQLYGYMKTGDETYITRSGDARKLRQHRTNDVLRANRNSDHES